MITQERNTFKTVDKRKYVKFNGTGGLYPNYDFIARVLNAKNWIVGRYPTPNEKFFLVNKRYHQYHSKEIICLIESKESGEQFLFGEQYLKEVKNE